MAVQIQDGNGSAFFMAVNPDGSINTVVSGITIDIGSAIIQLEDIYVRSGLITIDQNPTISNPAYSFLYVYSGTNTGVTGSAIGSILQELNGVTYTQVFTYDGDNITQIGSWI